ncbi:hypothetical protein XELAEV_18039024mg [Xenopus laevis]|uniref:Uncharacterized protein n=1 Tax=Xenopus laevis TaxID=8355 RepID=A0A974C715_XENLA|nr:hypothetical protein XELAEV_18039024mg [Xenopus laevis]
MYGFLYRKWYMVFFILKPHYQLCNKPVAPFPTKNLQRGPKQGQSYSALCMAILCPTVSFIPCSGVIKAPAMWGARIQKGPAAPMLFNLEWSQREYGRRAAVGGLGGAL